MIALVRTLTTFAALGLTNVAFAGMIVTHDTEKVGDKPSTVAEHKMPQSALADYVDMPTSSLGVVAAGGGLSTTEGSQPFGLSSMSSSLREETSQLLGELNAQQQDDGSILVALPGDVLFDFDKADIRADARPVLDQLVTVLTNYAAAKVEISGHTDAKGSDEYNQTLSDQRAASVSTYLSSHGIDKNTLSALGKGESEPVAPNEKADGQDDPEGRQANRRVEFIITPLAAEE